MSLKPRTSNRSRQQKPQEIPGFLAKRQAKGHPSRMERFGSNPSPPQPKATTPPPCPTPWCCQRTCAECGHPPWPPTSRTIEDPEKIPPSPLTQCQDRQRGESGLPPSELRVRETPRWNRAEERGSLNFLRKSWANSLATLNLQLTCMNTPGLRAGLQHGKPARLSKQPLSCTKS